MNLDKPRTLKLLVTTREHGGAGAGTYAIESCWVEDAVTGEPLGVLPVTAVEYKTDSSSPAVLTISTFRGRVTSDV